MAEAGNHSQGAMSRRGILGGMMGAGAMMGGLAGMAMPQVSLAKGRAVPSLDTPEGRFRAYIMMRAALDEQLVIGYVSGSYFGVVDAEVTPLWDVVGATFARYRKRADGAYEGVTGEIAHFFTPNSSEVPGRFLNPYTGKWVTDPRTNLPPARITLLPTLDLEMPRQMPGTKFDHVIKAPEVRGDDIWVTEVTRVGMPMPAGKPAFHYSEMVTMHASMKDLARTDAARIPCGTSFTNVVDWRPWMDMAGHPGHLTAIGSGRYGVTLDQLPARWTEATRQQFPAILDDPGSLIEKLWKS